MYNQFRAAGPYEDTRTGPNHVSRLDKILRTGTNQVLRPKKDLKTCLIQVLDKNKLKFGSVLTMF